jgi:hypothetical protein
VALRLSMISSCVPVAPDVNKGSNHAWGASYSGAESLGSTPTTGAIPDPKLVSKNITPSREVGSFGNYESRRLAD